MQEFPSGIDTKAVLKQMQGGTIGGLTGEAFDKSYVSFVDENDRSFNDEVADNLDIYALGKKIDSRDQ